MNSAGDRTFIPWRDGANLKLSIVISPQSSITGLFRLEIPLWDRIQEQCNLCGIRV